MNAISSSSAYSQSSQALHSLMSKTSFDFLKPFISPSKVSQDSLILVPTFVPSNLSNSSNKLSNQPSVIYNSVPVSFEPAPKVKFETQPTKKCHQPQTNAAYKPPIKSSLGTIDEVFNETSTKPLKNNKTDDYDISISSLSDDLEDSDVEVIEPKKAEAVNDDDDDCMIIDNIDQDTLTNHPNNLFLKGTQSNSQNFIKYDYFEGQTNNPDKRSQDGFKLVPLKDANVNKKLQGLQRLRNSTKDFFFKSEYSESFKVRNTVQKVKNNLEVKPLNSKRSFPFEEKDSKEAETVVVVHEVENDLASNYTGSTGLGLDSRNPSIIESVEKSQEQTPFNDEIGMPLETKPEEKVLKKVPKRVIKPKKEENVKLKKTIPTKNKKQNGSSLKKREKSLHENYEESQSYWKVERRLNKLQLLRYQQEFLFEEEEVIKSLDFFSVEEPLAKKEQVKGARNDKGSKGNQEELVANIPIGNDHQAVIPPRDFKSGRKIKTVPNQVWNPEMIEQGKLETYISNLCKIIKETVVQEDKALRILKIFNMNMAMALTDVKQNMLSYKELLQVKARKTRRSTMTV